jgi:DNA-binding response OmpR family regulator
MHRKCRPLHHDPAAFSQPAANLRNHSPAARAEEIQGTIHCPHFILHALKQRILVVEDEPEAFDLVEFNLKQAGFEVLEARDGLTAVKKARELTPDLVVLDLMLPELDGWEVCKKLRRDAETSGIPIIMVTARAGEIDRVLGLELGAEDYLTKPFHPRELLLRVKRALDRRSARNAERGGLHFGNLVIDVDGHDVSWRGRVIRLTPTEFKLLKTMAERSGRVQSREQLLHDVWDYTALANTRTVDTHMRRLRRKLGSAAKYLDTVRGVGYRFLKNK